MTLAVIDSICNRGTIVICHLIFDLDLLCVIARLPLVQLVFIPSCLWGRAGTAYLKCLSLCNLLLSLLFINTLLFLIADELSIRQEVLLSASLLLRS